MIRQKLSLTLLILLLLTGITVAQDAEASETTELPSIPYFQSSSGFNVPVLNDWTSQGDADRADFVNEAYSARILVSSIATTDAAAAIEAQLDELLPGSSDNAPFYEATLNLNDGTWLQRLYNTEAARISAMAKVRDNITDVVLLIDEAATSETYSLVLRTADLMDAEATLDNSNPLPGIQAAAQILFDIPEEASAQDVETLSADSGSWVRGSYDAGEAGTVTAYGLIFGNATYTILSQGTEEADIAVADAINSMFLGFFITPDNSIYLYGGLAASALVMLVLIGSYYVRQRNALRDLALIEQLSED